jgi:predicted O-linked N-acetylglucosamine transferase (SPINDLY family)
LGDASAWANAIAGDRLHALIYPEIGMETIAVRLACTRLARVQCVAWGHPVTSGLPTVDYFLSSELMEPADGDAHYRERLVRLPGLSIYYEAQPNDTGSLTRKGLGLAGGAVVYLCCQALYKYLPAYDSVLAAIADRVPSAQFLFIADGNPATTDILRARMTAAFAAQGLDANRHIVFTPPVAPDQFPSLLKAGDVYLDSIGWSGGNTTLEAAGCGLPIVTLPGPLMRGRHSAAILRQMELPEYIAPDRMAYIELAARLGNDRKFRAQAATSVSANRAKLYGDLRPIRALEDFLVDAVAGASAN